MRSPRPLCPPLGAGGGSAVGGVRRLETVPKSCLFRRMGPVKPPKAVDPYIALDRYKLRRQRLTLCGAFKVHLTLVSVIFAIIAVHICT